jgi:uncharacterized RDD family membrane protein YckC
VIPTPSKDPTDVVGRRIFAFILDVILITAIIVIVAALVAKRYTNAPSGSCVTLREQSTGVTCVQIGSHVYSVSGARMSLLWFAGLASAFIDFVVLPGVTGASIGKLMLGLRTVDATGALCGFGKAFGRTILLIVDLFFLIGLFIMIGSRPHKRIGDNVAGTFVVDASDVGIPVVRAPMPLPEYAYTQPPAWGAPQPPPPWGGPHPDQPAWGAPPPPPPAWGEMQPQQRPPPAWNAPPETAPAPEAPPPSAPAPPPTSSEGAPNPGGEPLQ